MTNCLFAHGVAAVTAELKVRFRQAVNLGKFATVRAVIAERFPPLFRLKAEVIQNGAVVATAEAAFIDNAGFGGRRTQAAPLAAKPSL
jgi:acyl-CoA thioesterase FadM